MIPSPTTSSYKMVAAALILAGSASLALAQQPQQGMGGMNGMGMGGMGMGGMGPGSMNMGPGGMHMTMPGMPQMHMSPGCMMMTPGQMNGMGGMGMGGMGGGMMLGLPIEQRLIQLKSQLAITDAQSSNWDAYAKAATAHAAAHHNGHEAMMKAMQSPSVVDRVDAHLKTMEGFVASLKEYKPALETLYASLNDQQRQWADALLVPGCLF